VANWFRAKPLHGIHALLAPPRCERTLTCEGQVDVILSPSLAIAFPPCFFSTERVATGGEPVATTEKSTASKHHHLIPLCPRLTVQPFWPQVELTKLVALPRPPLVPPESSSHVVVLLWPLTAFLL
jgi:hypothetical protein